MRNRVPVPAAERPPIPDFTPVPRAFRHDGWPHGKLGLIGPARRKAFDEALADCGSVRRRPMAMVAMANANARVRRRAPGAGEQPMASANIGNIRRSRCRLKDIALGTAPPLLRNRAGGRGRAGAGASLWPTTSS